MLESGDPITPRLNFVKYFEHPPLYAWLISISFNLFGQNEFAARFPGALCGFLGVLWAYHLGRRLFGRRTGLLSALFLGTSLGYVMLARISNPDTAFALCLSVSLGSFLLASRENASRKYIYYHLLYFFSALAVLSKGLEGIVLPLGAILLYVMLTRRWTLLRQMQLPTGIPLLLLIGAPWFILVGMRNPEFFQIYTGKQLERFLGTGPDPHQPIWFFVPILLVCMLPWSFFLTSSAANCWQGRHKEGADGRGFLILWAALAFGLFSISRSKAAQDILGVLPALAILMGKAFSDVLQGELKREKPLSYAISVASGMAAILAIIHPHVAQEPLFSPRGGVVIGIILILGAILGALSTRKKDAVRLVAVLCLIWFHLELIGMPYVLRQMAQRTSSKELALLIKETAGGNAWVACWSGYDPALSFYTRRKILVVGEDRGMPAFGNMQEEDSGWHLDLGQFQKLWDSGQPLFTLIPDSNLDQLRGSVKSPVKILKKKGKLALVTNG